VCRSRSVAGFRCTLARGVSGCGIEVDDGSWTVTLVAVSGKETPERRERAHHWIARRGCGSPGGYRGPIGLVGGSRLLIRDPRTVGFSTGQRGYGKPTSRSAGNDETQTQGPWVPSVGTQGPL
jgi:hypothetical protein